MAINAKIIPVRVAVRTRPLIQREIDENANECLSFIEESQQVVVNKSKAFTYDYIFDGKTKQEVVYDKAVSPLIDGIFIGYNGTVLAYGQTGSGKTYSMGSAHCVSEQDVTDESSGVIPRVIRDIFDGIEARKTHTFLVKVSYVEIYKEEVKDLLAPPEARKPLSIRENLDGSICMPGLLELMVSSPVETLRHMEMGNKARSTASTAMNLTSSRSHAIFTIILESKNLADSADFTCSKFHLVDLAGSERAKRTKAEGERLQEGIKINSGLLALGNVISHLGEDPTQHIPYRVSKLTRLLQDSMGGNSHTLMIACISPAHTNEVETLNTLRYADRARKIKNKAIINIDPAMAELASLRKEVQRLRLLTMENGVCTTTTSAVMEVREEPKLVEKVNELKNENRKLLVELQKQLDSTTVMCEKAIASDMYRDQLVSKLLELQNEARQVTDDPENLTNAKKAVAEEILKNCIQGLIDLRESILEFHVNKDGDTVTLSATVNGINEPIIANEQTDQTSSPVNKAESERDAEINSEHILRSAQLATQLRELSTALAVKEDLAKKMAVGEENIGELKSKYEAKMKKLDTDITSLQSERDSLATALEVAKRSSENKGLSEKRRIRLIDLENQIKELKKEKKEKEKVAKLKVLSDQKINKLNSEIQTMKSCRVKLMRQIKEESLKFQSWKKEKEKEVKQLKQKDRQQAFKIVKLGRDFEKQQNVLRRKTEEAAASNRRLKEALNKQKAISAKRAHSQQSKESLIEKIKMLIEEDVEIGVRSKEAKKHFDDLEKDLRDVQQQLRQLGKEETAGKRRRTYTKQEVGESKRKQMALTNECELKEAQIKEMKSKLADAREIRARQHSRWTQINGVPDQKFITRHLVMLLVNSRFNEEELRCAANRSQADLQDVKSQLFVLEGKLEEVEKMHEANVTVVEQEHQEEVLFLTKQLNRSTSDIGKGSATEREKGLCSQLAIQAKVIEDLTKKEEAWVNEKALLLNRNSPFYFKQNIEDAKKPVAKRKLPAKESKLQLFDLSLLVPCVTANCHVASFQVYYEADDDSEISDYETESDIEYVPTPRKFRKRSTLNKKKVGCGCSKNACSNKVCSCVKQNGYCNDDCMCNKNVCQNLDMLVKNQTNILKNIENLNSTFTIDKEDDSITQPPNQEPVQKKSKRRSDLFQREGLIDEEPVPTIPTVNKLYTPCYFPSPVLEYVSDESERDSSPSIIPVTPRVVIEKKVIMKRKLNSNENFFNSPSD